MIAHHSRCHDCGLFNTAQHTDFVFVRLYPASDYKVLASIVLDAKVQDALPAVQMSCFVGNQWVNKKSSYQNVHFKLVFLTLQTAIKRVGMAMSVYCVDCGNIAHRSCCD